MRGRLKNLKELIRGLELMTVFSVLSLLTQQRRSIRTAEVGHKRFKSGTIFCRESEILSHRVVFYYVILRAYVLVKALKKCFFEDIRT